MKKAEIRTAPWSLRIERRPAGERPQANRGGITWEPGV